MPAEGPGGRQAEETAPASPPARTHLRTAVSVALAAVAVDQLTKAWALRALDGGEIIEIAWTLQFRLTFNTGAAFSIAVGHGQWIALAAIAVVLLLAWYGRSVTSRLGAVSLGLVIGGAVGNLADRAFRGDDGLMSGAVVDFVDLQWWPVFNVADACIVVGALLLVVSTLRSPGGRTGAEPATSP